MIASMFDCDTIADRNVGIIAGIAVIITAIGTVMFLQLLQ